MPRDTHSLLDMLRKAKLIRDFLGDIDRDAFDKDLLRQHGIIYAIIVIGEAANRISEAFKGAHPEIPWQQIKGMRNIIVHDYDQIDLDVVWGVATVNIPSLIVIIERLIPLQLPQAPAEPDEITGTIKDDQAG
jgi:uncharacterized protein with HEPN domain